MTVARLSKLHATGNDFLVLAAGDGTWRPDAAVANQLCDRHRGVGADGFITMLPGTGGADVTMILRNADGGVAEMSGNGIRCLASVAVRHGMVSGDELVVDTGAGRRVVLLERDDQNVLRDATVDMGPVTFEPSAIPVEATSAFELEAAFGGVQYSGDAAGLGNPHWVIFVDDPEAAGVETHGPLLEADHRFPRGTNVEFVAVDDRGSIRMRVWERGVGETLSCGSGACAAAAVARRRDLVGDEVTVHLPGGDLRVELGETVRLGGPVRHIFDVDIDPDRLSTG